MRQAGGDMADGWRLQACKLARQMDTRSKSMPRKLREYGRRAVIHLPSQLLRLLRYPRETLFVNGYADFDKARPSILFFTTHKCASTLMVAMLAHINRRVLGLTHLNLAAYCWDTAGAAGETIHEHLSRMSRSYFKDRGILYAPLRYYIDIPHLDHARVFAMLRDPRDVLVSGYYSAKYSHRMPADPVRRRTFLAHREWLMHTSVDEYVLQFAPSMAERYAAYRQHIPRSALLTYEQMWWDFSGFIDRLAAILGVAFDAKLNAKLQGMAKPGRKGSEDVTTHRRRGEPGDYKVKLRSETAAHLTRQFEETLAWIYG